MVAKTSPAPAYPSRTRHRLETRDKVFEAALAEFRASGVANAQIENIVRRAGVARGTFYLHFPTKDHVLIELLRRNQAELAARLRAFRTTSMQAFLRRLVDSVADDARSEDASLWHELFSVLGRHAAALRSEANPLVETMTAFFATAQERGDVRRDISAFDLASAFLPSVLGLLQMRLGDDSTELRHALHRVVDVFVRGTQVGREPAGESPA